MIIDDVDLELISSGIMRATWTGVAGYVTWIFVDGEFYDGPVTIAGVSKTYEFPVDPEGVNHIEIHEIPSSQSAESNENGLEQKPYIYWGNVDDADEYRIYYREDETDTNYVLQTIAAFIGQEMYVKRIGKDLDRWGGKYWWFRVEARTTEGAQSARDEWPIFLKGLPAMVETATVSNVGSDIRLTISV